MEDLPNSSTCPNLLKNQTSGKRAGGEYMPLFGMCAISEGRAGAGRSDRNTQGRCTLNGAGDRGHYCRALPTRPHFTSHTSQEARRMRHPPAAVLPPAPSTLPLTAWGQSQEASAIPWVRVFWVSPCCECNGIPHLRGEIFLLPAKSCRTSNSASANAFSASDTTFPTRRRLLSANWGIDICMGLILVLTRLCY